jgi:hypothetical protein
MDGQMPGRAFDRHIDGPEVARAHRTAGSQSRPEEA